MSNVTQMHSEHHNPVVAHAANELRFLANRGIDHAMQSAWNTMRAYDDDEIRDE